MTKTMILHCLGSIVTTYPI